ncbi:DinB family protein [Roseivirga sp. E12]|uniref:DinB family protein n=1 Tax=Roseivirga sp. E12 TaxID=2819237 RepID=UPI001ABD205B|nr:DinB family protein [Roseivirga sp. E12]MBO3699797.1 DinB family protein [Roseivirga sp. E12]
MKTTLKQSAVALTLILSATLLFTSMKSADDGGYDWMKNRLNASKAFTVEVLEAMPEDSYDYKPNDDQRTFAAQAYHIVYSIDYFRRALEQGAGAQWAPGDENSKTKEELVTWANEQFDAINTFIIDHESNDAFTAGVMSYLDHNAHHRGQIVTYLRMKGIAPPNYR